MALTATQRKALSRRTTPTSRSRLLQRIRGTTPQPKAQPGAQPVINPNDFFVPAIDIARRQLDRNFGDTMEDIGISRQRGATDFTLNNQQLGEDYSSSIANLNRRYAQLGTNQTENSYAAGAGTSSTLAEQARIRAQNLQLDKEPIDTANARAVGENARNYERGFGSQGSVTLAAQRAGRDYPISQYDLDLQAIGAAQDAGFIPSAPAAAPKAKPPGAGPPGPGYQFNKAANKWVKTGSPPGKGYHFDFARNKWVK